MKGYCSLYLTTFKDVDHFVLFHPDIPTRNVYMIISDPIPQIWVLLPLHVFSCWGRTSSKCWFSTNTWTKWQSNFLVWVWAIIFTHQNSCDWTYPVVRHEQSVPPKGVHGNFSAAKHMFAENLPPSLHRLILLKEQHGCSARKLGIKGYFWTCECHQLYLPVASCFTWRLVEKDIRGGEGGSPNLYIHNGIWSDP